LLTCVLLPVFNVLYFIHLFTHTCVAASVFQ